jgi:benzoyl-CoA reductase/2-hydroxyglutaryl-CoA dehydratase subunit BcrC/BadD/HgdB
MSNADNPGDAGAKVVVQRTCSCSVTGASAAPAVGRLGKVLSHFDCMVDHCLEYVDSTKAQGRPLVGIMCEFTPREIILAAGGVPVCLCGGSADTIAAAERLLPQNLCPLIKSTFGYHVSGSNPFLKQADLVVAETTCDGKKKMFEVMAESKPMYVLDLPQTAEAPEVEGAWIRELRDFQRFLEERFGTEITDDRLRGAIRLMNRERGLRRQLADCMIQDPPPITGRQLLDMKSIISGMESDLEQYEEALRGLADGERTGDNSKAIRVLLTGVPVVHGAERILDVIEGRGCVVVAMENCTGLKPILEDVDETAPDPIVAIAQKYLHLPCSVMMHNESRIQTLRALAAKFRPHCVIELVWQACLTYDVESYFVRKVVEEELRLPYLKITTDYSPSDSARVAARVDALIETVLAHC